MCFLLSSIDWGRQIRRSNQKGIGSLTAIILGLPGNYKQTLRHLCFALQRSYRPDPAASVDGSWRFAPLQVDHKQNRRIIACFFGMDQFIDVFQAANRWRIWESADLLVFKCHPFNFYKPFFLFVCFKIKIKLRHP